jgi:hypothetical protein
VPSYQRRRGGIHIAAFAACLGFTHLRPISAINGRDIESRLRLVTRQQAAADGESEAKSISYGNQTAARGRCPTTDNFCPRPIPTKFELLALLLQFNHA